jgi:hypothetical protein
MDTNSSVPNGSRQGWTQTVLYRMVAAISLTSCYCLECVFDVWLFQNVVDYNCLFVYFVVCRRLAILLPKRCASTQWILHHVSQNL